MNPKRKIQGRNRSNVKETADIKSSEERIDDPYLRHQETMMDLAAKGKPIGKLRLAALKQARQMPVSDDGTPGPVTAEHIFSQPAIPEKSNWVQMGPTAIPHGQSVSNLPVLVTGRITAVVIDSSDPDNVIYLGTAQGGIWKTTDSGRNWIAKSDYAPSLSIGSITMDPMSPSILYAGTGEGNIAWWENVGGKHPSSYYGCGILKTTDGGEKWTLLGGDDNEFNGASFFRLAINPLKPSTIFATTTIGLYRSTDSGEHWSKMSRGLPEITTTIIAATDIVINQQNPNIAYVAFWGGGIYKSKDANAEEPIWEKLDGQNEYKLPSNGFKRIALGISSSSSNFVYALMANNEGPLGTIDKFYYTDDDGQSWKKIELPGMQYDKYYPYSIGPFGSYSINVAVDPSTPHIVYLSGVSIWKAIHNAIDGTWRITDIGQYIHADNHAFAFNHNDPFVIYAGNDGGIYKSIDGGETWIDVINEGLCITQFEFMDQHPSSDAVLFGGTQDNGTLQFRNNPAFYYSDYGDGGFVSIDPQNPKNVIHQYIRTTLLHSEQAGKRDSWKEISEGIADSPSLFYAPFTLDQENSKNIAFGSNKVFLDADQGRKKWKLDNGSENSIKLNLDPGDLVSSINYVKSNLMYVGTTKGKAYRLTNTGDRWNVTPIHSDPLPNLYIWDMASIPGLDNEVIVVMAGYGSQEKPTSHIWKATIPDDQKKTAWENISGEGTGRLPDTPINSIVIDPKPPHTIYVGTDIGVFRSSANNDKTWIRFSHGLPNCAVYDMRLHTSLARRLLRVVTHGRGAWERDLDSESMPDTNLFVRDHLMDTGRFSPSPDNIKAAFVEDYPQTERQNNVITSVTTLKWDMCADIKVDSPTGNPPSFQMDIEAVDYVNFEYKLIPSYLVSGRVNRVYVQVHNRGIKEALKPVRIKLLCANPIDTDPIKYPDLPQDFWTSFPNNHKDKSNWMSIGLYKVLPDPPKTLTQIEPTVVSWQWNVPPIGEGQIGILVVIDSEEDPIPASNKIFDIETLVKNEKHVGLRSINVVNQG